MEVRFGCDTKYEGGYGMTLLPRVLSAVLLVTLTASTSGSDQKQKSSCWDQATTQQAMNSCASQDWQRADAELNRVYRQVVAAYSSTKDQQEKIVKAQRAWTTFRDAEVDAWYPESERPNRGSIFPMCRGQMLAQLTEERTRELRGMLKHSEGDVCSQ
jgi:uncharacterized protein YecT (DUF1311 family)